MTIAELKAKMREIQNKRNNHWKLKPYYEYNGKLKQWSQEHLNFAREMAIIEKKLEAKGCIVF